ncbi:MAG: response regulator transcription factor [Desulfobacterales bacterium]
MSQKKSVLIVDDHPLFREGLKSIVTSNRQYEVVGEAGTGKEAIELVRQLTPDLILLDLSLPDASGLELIGVISKCSAQTRILIVSMHAKIDYIVKAFQAGATGYIVKGSTAEKLLQGMEHVLKGDYFMDTSVSQQVVKKLVGLGPKETMATGSNYDALTAREQEVMALLANGQTVSQAAERLFISPKTVENHRSSIMRKLGIHKTLDLVRFAARLGLIDIDLWKE